MNRKPRSSVSKLKIVLHIVYVYAELAAVEFLHFKPDTNEYKHSRSVEERDTHSAE